MPPAVSSVAPASCVAGDTVRWRLSAPDTPPGGEWTLQLVLAGPDNVVVPVAEDPDAPGAWLATLPATTTAALPAGSYAWVAQAARGTGPTLERYTVDHGRILVQADPAGLIGAESLSVDEIELRRVDGLIAQVQGDPLAEYVTDGVTGKRHDLASLYSRQNQLRARINRSRRGGRVVTSIGVRFGPIS